MTPSSTEDPRAAIRASSDPSYLYVPLGLASGSFALISLLLPIYARELGASATAIGGLFTVFTATVLLLRPLVGWVLDHYGRRPFLLVAFGFYVVSMTTFSFGADLRGLYVARFIQGMGAAVMWLAVRTMIADTVADGERARVMGRVTESSVRGSMAGAFLGFTFLGFLPMAEAWRWAFLGYAAMAFVALFLGYRTIPETRQPGEPEPPPPWTRGMIRLALVVATVAFAEALIGPVFLILMSDRFEVSPENLGAVFAGGILYAFLPSRAGAWGDRVGRWRVLALGLLLAAGVNSSFPFLPSVWVLVAVYAVLASAWCMTNPQLDALVAAQTSARSRGRVMARFELVSGSAAAVGPLLGGWLYDNFDPRAPFLANSALLLVTAAAVVLLLRSSEP